MNAKGNRLSSKKRGERAKRAKKGGGQLQKSEEWSKRSLTNRLTKLNSTGGSLKAS